MASVLLGLCEEPVTSKTATCWNINKFGGMPDWYQAADLHPNCGICGLRSVFICQLYCPVSGSSYHRTVYIFACCSQPCRNKEGSWTVLRFQSPYKSEPTKRLLLSKCDTDYWGLDESSWSDDERVDQHDVAKSESPKHEIDADSSKSESDSLMDFGDLEAGGKLDKSVTSSYTNGEMNIKVTASCSISTDEEAATKMSQLSVMDVGCLEMEAGGSTSAAFAVDKEEIAVVAEDLLLNPKDSILSQVLVNCQLSSSEGCHSSLNDSCLTSIVLDSYYINAYDETEFVADMKHWLDLEHKYLKEDSGLRSFLHGCRDELPSGKQRKEKKSKKSSHLDIEKDDNNEYDKKPDNFDRAVVKFSEKLKLCPHQVIRYSYNGTPLHFHEQGLKQIIPVCTCGSSRIFEMQLMPGIVDYLRTSQDSDCIIEFGSVYIYTCAKNCWVDGRTEAKQEFVFSVEYLDQGLFRT